MKTINLTELRIDDIDINYAEQRVIVHYKIFDDTGSIWKTGHAIFWVTLPPAPEGGYPSNWFQLPSGYLSTLVSLRNDANTALTNVYL